MQSDGCDWIEWDGDDAVDAVTVFGNHVFVENLRSTDVGAEPFETILRRNARNVVGNYEDNQNSNVRGQGLLRVAVSCRTPDDATMQVLLSDMSIEAYPRNKQQGFLPSKLTWEEYSRDKSDPEPNIYIRDNPVMLDYATVDIQGLEIRYTALTFLHPIEIVER